jgi:hypothetical protein
MSRVPTLSLALFPSPLIRRYKGLFREELSRAGTDQSKI